MSHTPEKTVEPPSCFAAFCLVQRYFAGGTLFPLPARLRGLCGFWSIAGSGDGPFVLPMSHSAQNVGGDAFAAFAPFPAPPLTATSAKNLHASLAPYFRQDCRASHRALGADRKKRFAEWTLTCGVEPHHPPGSTLAREREANPAKTVANSICFWFRVPEGSGGLPARLEAMDWAANIVTRDGDCFRDCLDFLLGSEAWSKDSDRSANPAPYVRAFYSHTRTHALELPSCPSTMGPCCPVWRNAVPTRDG